MNSFTSCFFSTFQKRFCLLLLLLSGSVFNLILNAQQVPDTAYRFALKHIAYPSGEGPLIFIDAAHHNFHTSEGGFSGFSRLLEQDGYRVKSLNQSVTVADALKECNILVIVNALHADNEARWFLPVYSAFTKEEVTVLKQWVINGGSLLLIADHMPFAGAADDLGKAFGFEFINGFAITGQDTWPPTVFYTKNGTLHFSPVTKGIKEDENIDSVATYTGSAFKVPQGSMGVLSFLSAHQSLQPDTAWRFNDKTPSISLEGYYQGALLEVGKGKVAVFGEAAMFTAQLVNGSFRVGINSESAPQNAQFTLNLIHWLDGLKDYSDGRK